MKLQDKVTGPLPGLFRPVILSCGESGVSMAALQAARSEGLGYGGWCAKGGFNRQNLPVKKWFGLTPHPWAAGDAARANAKWSRCVLVLHTGGVLIPKWEHLMFATTRRVRDSATIGSLAAQAKSKLFEERGVGLSIDMTSTHHLSFWPPVAETGDPLAVTLSWLEREDPAFLNIVGPEDNECLGVEEESRAFLLSLFHVLRERMEQRVEGLEPTPPTLPLAPTPFKPSAPLPAPCLPIIGGKSKRT